jgi:hypothetical protein
MAASDQKKQKKRKKERSKARKAVLKKRYPPITVSHDGNDPFFMKDVAQVASRFKFSKKECCDGSQRFIFHAFRQIGEEGIDEYIRNANPNDESLNEKILDTLLFHIGDWIFKRLPKKYQQNPLPFFYFQLLPRNNYFEISFDFLPQVSSDDGTIYSSTSSPSIQTGGREYRVGFFRHAIERTCERMALKKELSYVDFRKCYRYFRHCVYYKPIELYDGKEAIQLYAPLSAPDDDSSLSYFYMEDVAGINAEWAANGKYHHVLGYCPIEFVDDFAVAKTFLLPGYRGTPEYGLISKARLRPQKRTWYRETAKALTSETLLKREGCELLRFFHDNGCPQVIRLPKPVLDLQAA